METRWLRYDRNDGLRSDIVAGPKDIFEGCCNVTKDFLVALAQLYLLYLLLDSILG